MSDRRHARDGAVRIGGRRGTSESEATRDRSVAKSSLQPRGGVKCRRQHDVSRATVNKDRRENYRVENGGKGGLEERASSSKSAYVHAYTRSVRGIEQRGEGVTWGREEKGDGRRKGSTCQGETCHSLIPCHLHKQTYITGRQAASYVFPFMFPHARSHKPVSLVSRAAQSFTVAGSAPALTTVLLPAVESKIPSPFPPRSVPD